MDKTKHKDRAFEIIHRESLFQGYFRVDRFHIRQEIENGNWSDVFSREVFEGAPKASAVLLFDPKQDKIVMVEEFRAGPMAAGDDPFLTQLVTGMIGVDEEPEAAARREAAEEAGCIVTDLVRIAAYYPSPGTLSEHTTLFIGRTRAPEDGAVHGVATENEYIRTVVMDAPKAISLLYTGKLRDAHSIMALQWFALRHTEIRSRWLVSDASTMII